MLVSKGEVCWENWQVDSYYLSSEFPTFECVTILKQPICHISHVELGMQGLTWLQVGDSKLRSGTFHMYAPQ